MVHFCFVVDCKCSSHDKGVKFFKYPTEKILQAEWLVRSGHHPDDIQTSKYAFSTIRICSMHFEDNYHSFACQFLGEQLSGCQCSPGKRVPSLNLPGSFHVESQVNTIVNNNKRQHDDSRRVEIF